MSGPSNHKKAKPLNTKYILHNVELESVPAAKYLGSPLRTTSHGPNILRSPQKRQIKLLVPFKEISGSIIRTLAYKTLVRPQLEYASTVWYPHTTTDINKVEAVQRSLRAARWATRDYRYTSNATAMLKDQYWRTLEQRRIDSRLVVMYKVTYDLVAIPAPDYLV